MTHSDEQSNSIFGYADKLHARAGDVVSFKISSEGDQDFNASLVRIVNGGMDSLNNKFQEIEIPSDFAGDYHGQHKTIYNGSFAKLDMSCSLDGRGPFTVQFFLYPTRLDSDQDMTVLALKGAHGSGWKLSLRGSRLSVHHHSDANSEIVAELDGISEAKWHLVAVSFTGTSVLLRTWQYAKGYHASANHVFRESQGAAQIEPPFPSGSMYLGAEITGLDRNGQSVIANALDGKIASLRISRGVSSTTEVFSATDYVPDRQVLPALCGVWNFIAAQDFKLKNELCGKEKGELCNLPLLGVTGAHWNGSRHDFSNAPHHYNAIHFHSDDLYDCHWKTDFTYTVPKDLKSGIYAAKILNADQDIEYIPFFVAPVKDASSLAPIAFIVPTMTYLAYGNGHMTSEQLGFDVDLWGGQIVRDERGYKRHKDHPEFGSSLYDCHLDGSGRHNSSWLRPIMTMRPNTYLWTLSVDTLITSWLERQGFEYDIITDHLVHEEGADLLGKYSAVVSGNHPEYVTSEIIDAISHYTTDLGGRFIYMGGNGYYWVTGVYDAAPAAVEIRRGVAGSQGWMSDPGEHYLYSTGELGGLWRHVGRPPQEVFGVGTRAMGFTGSVGYAVKPDWDNPRVAFLVDGVAEDVLGDYGILGGGAAGEEIDGADVKQGTPPHALVVARSCDHPEGMMLAREEQNFTVPASWTQDRVRADLVFFETPSGGAMLSVGSMTWCGSLSHNDGKNGVSRLTANALRRFTDQTPFDFPPP